MIDRQYSEPVLVELYDAFNAATEDLDFYLPFVLSAESVLDVGCGTGELLRLARDAGHRGRLCGLDPAMPMLRQARRKRTDVEWTHGALDSVDWRREFDLVVMSGHAFQVLVEDHELRGSLRAIRSALNDGGRFAFETRNPLARAWEGWTSDRVRTVVHHGRVVCMAHEVETPVVGDVVSFTTTFTSPDWVRPEVSRSTLRFPGQGLLAGFLRDAGLAIEEQYGDWDRSPVTDTSPEIITVARPADGR